MKLFETIIAVSLLLFVAFSCAYCGEDETTSYAVEPSAIIDSESETVGYYLFNDSADKTKTRDKSGICSNCHKSDESEVKAEILFKENLPSESTSSGDYKSSDGNNCSRYYFTVPMKELSSAGQFQLNPEYLIYKTINLKKAAE